MTGVGVGVGRGVLVAVGVKVAVAVSVGKGLGVIVTEGTAVFSIFVVGGILICPHPVRMNARTNPMRINLIIFSSMR